MHLSCAFEVSFGTVKALCHHAEVDMLRAQHVPHLPQHFLHAHIASRVARPVVPGKEQLQLFARAPTLAESEHPTKAADFDQRTDPRDKKKVRHARALSTAA